MLTRAEIERDLPQFYGTESWYRWSILFRRHLLTDGTKFVADSAGAYWLMDAIASHHGTCIKDPMLRDHQFWTLKVNPDKTAVLICERDTGNEAFRQEIPYTDFPLPEISIWVEPMGDGNYCILLPSEH
jgi:hypothetical protein